MKRSFLHLVTLLILTIAFSNAYTAQAQVRAYRVNDNQVRKLLNRLETRTDRGLHPVTHQLHSAHQHGGRHCANNAMYSGRSH